MIWSLRRLSIFQTIINSAFTSSKCMALLLLDPFYLLLKTLSHGGSNLYMSKNNIVDKVALNLYLTKPVDWQSKEEFIR